MRAAPAIRRGEPGATRYGVAVVPRGFVRLALVLPLPGSGLRVCEHPGGCQVWGSQRRRVGRRSTYWCIAHDPGAKRRAETL